MILIITKHIYKDQILKYFLCSILNNSYNLFIDIQVFLKKYIAIIKINYNEM